MGSKITEEIPQLNEANVPVEGQDSATFRHNAGVAWGWLRNLAISLKTFITQLNVVKAEIDTHAQNVAAHKQYVQESRGVIEGINASLPETTVNDAVDSTTSVYSSSKINELLDDKSNKTHTHTAADVGAYSKTETFSKDEINTKLGEVPKTQSNIANFVMTSGTVAINGNNIDITNGELIYPNGKDSNGFKHKRETFTGSLPLNVVANGNYYLARELNTGNIKAYEKVAIGSYEKESADDVRPILDLATGLWHMPTGGELITNGKLEHNANGWTLPSSGVSYSDGGLNTSSSNNVCIFAPQMMLEVGVRYVIDLKCTVYSGLYDIRLAKSSNLSNNTIDLLLVQNSITSDTKTEFVYDGSFDTIGIYQNIATGRIESLSVYKSEATPNTALTNPICFIDEKPYSVENETPQLRLDEFPSLPKQAMGSLVVDFLETLNNTFVLYLEDYGIERVYNAERYTIKWDNIPNFSGNYRDYEAELQLFINGIWARPNTNYSGRGSDAHSLEEGIVIQTARNSVAGASLDSAGGHNITIEPTNAPALVIVTYKGKAKRV